MAKDRGQSVQDSLDGFAITIAVGIALWFAPWLLTDISPHVYEALVSKHGHELALLASYAFAAICAAAIFFLSKAVLLLAIMFVVSRVMMYAI